MSITSHQPSAYTSQYAYNAPVVAAYAPAYTGAYAAYPAHGYGYAYGYKK